MKKMMKFLVGAATTGAAIAGTFYVIKKYFNKDESEDFDEEEFEDVFADEVDDREYVTLDIDGNEMEGNESEEDAEDDAE